MAIKGAIFDVDGTLLDSMPAWDGLDEQFLLNHGKHSRGELRTRFSNMNYMQIAQYYIDTYELPMEPLEVVIEIAQMAAEHYKTDIPLKPGVREYLDTLQANGVKMMILTANTSRLIQLALDRLDLNDYFVAIMEGNDTTQGKDNPETFEKALELLGTPKGETYVFEDSLYAVESARKPASR